MPTPINTALTAVVLIALLCVLLPTAVLLVRLVMRPDRRLDAVETELLEVQARIGQVNAELESVRLELRSATETLKRTELTLNAFVQRAIERST